MPRPRHLLTIFLFTLPLHASDGEVELADNMARLQYFTHKATLAVKARNQPLAAFYLHELEEVTEETRAIADYEGYPVGKLTTSMLTPALAGMDASLDKADWPAASAAIDTLVQACNQCHQSTDHGFIRIQRRTDNPYMQDFRLPD